MTFGRKSKVAKATHTITKHLFKKYIQGFFLQKRDCVFYCSILKLIIEVLLLVKQHLSHFSWLF